jgi:hypothetical protein
VRILEALSPITVQNPSYDGYVPLPTVGDFLRGPNGQPAQVQLSARHSPLAILLQRTLSPGFIGPLVGHNEHPRDSSRWRLRRIVSNLDPERLDSADFLDLSGKEQTRVNVLGGSLCIVYHRPSRNAFMPFPTGAHGFLYAAEDTRLRFRVTKDANPASFLSGWDLLLPDGRPWMVRPTSLAGVLGLKV